jgi:poly(A) polymerase
VDPVPPSRPDVAPGDGLLEPDAADHYREALTAALLADDVATALWSMVDSGLAELAVPELPALRLEQDPIHRHKDVLAHTIAVTAKTPHDLRIRLAALFHDIGKPATRRIDEGGVTFRHHEAVGAKMTRKRLRALGYPEDIVRDVTELVRLSGRFKGFAAGWSDSAVRRYARDAGPLLGHLNELVRSDCTTRNPRKRQELQHHVDDLERRIAELAEADRVAAERPLLDGQAVMEHLGLSPGPEVGAAMRFLLDLKRSEPDLDRDATVERLDVWWRSR